ncbi:predicted protein [Naegleria gruberi]|uniref:Predicted protein n=1 Tax=Naegleria gruberi TaxID=5762 RepID=D2V6F2_NAEGR|nr:uncharacterized protein NAEGRDRAFT_54652 [Naegleria gruberi]XP_002680305.1 uncharacterized protein NAEGRDRAFT_64414 [Naegleria gruberi]EFC35957.1 predicted protein [Naegleria gruberi]EFC47561.1 predicted protein [Naegleria gruberi]|eukprot:XP_002668701.1 predicted protein [Naegleria gruberi strain NEG-M]
MAVIHGSLARSGKVKWQTPRVAKTSDTSYHGGCSKYKQKSSSNLEYSAGAHRLERNYTAELELYDRQYKENHQRCDWVAERANIKRAEPVLLNSFHKFNTEKGFNKVEWNAIHHEERAFKKQTRNGRFRSEGRNHKKWHRNHPKDGIYQKRMVDVDDLDDVIEFSHLYDEE